MRRRKYREFIFIAYITIEPLLNGILARQKPVFSGKRLQIWRWKFQILVINGIFLPWRKKVSVPCGSVVGRLLCILFAKQEGGAEDSHAERQLLIRISSFRNVKLFKFLLRSAGVYSSRTLWHILPASVALGESSLHLDPFRFFTSSLMCLSFCPFRTIPLLTAQVFPEIPLFTKYLPYFFSFFF